MRHTAQVRRTRLGVAGAVAALSVGILGACTGEAADPTTSTPTSSASSSSASPTSPATSASPSPTSAYVPVKPKFPAAAKKQTDAGAVAFAEYYLETLDYAWSAPEGEVLKDLATTDCGLCTRLARTASDYVSKGERATGPVLSVQNVLLVSTSAKYTLIACDVDLIPVTYLDKNGAVTYRESAKALKWAVQLTWRDGWKFQALGER